MCRACCGTRGRKPRPTFTQIIPEGVRRTVEAIDAKLRGNPDCGESEPGEADDAGELPTPDNFLPFPAKPGKRGL
jgi:hypothetical protein